MGRVTTSERITSVRIRDGRLFHSTKPDAVAVEEPLDIRLNGQPLSMTMRTPGHDTELIHGFLHAEGYIQHREDIANARYCDGAVVEDESGLERNTYNVMDFTTRSITALPVIQKQFLTSSACGVCGAASVDHVMQRVRHDFPVTFTVEPSALLNAHRALADGQATFAKTGGVHAAALVSPTGERLVLREDVGRHNAVDKVIGWALMRDALPLTQAVLLVSSRASFEIVQKAAMAGIGFVACVSAPSSLAIETAKRLGITLCGFVRSGEGADGRFNVYAGLERLALAASES
ncbi:MAG: formate dehydrogenase accessory sulfurtransferase FdhD [Dermabacter sp.]|nr:formate dehydrogenase accessory sulfurtransferase FdhD [Dermabacter sp.]